MIDMEDFFKAEAIGKLCNNVDNLLEAKKLCDIMSDRARMTAATQFVLAVIEHSQKPVDEVLEDLNKAVREKINDGK